MCLGVRLCVLGCVCLCVLGCVCLRVLVSVAACVCVCVCLGVQLFSADNRVSDLTARILPVIGVYVVLESFHLISQGVLRGVGKQAAAALISFFGFNFVVVPCTFVIAMREDGGLMGLWVGMAVSGQTPLQTPRPGKACGSG